MIEICDHVSMNIEHLECFKTIVELGSFRKASEHLNKVQSAVSYSVKSLEEYVGYELFDRSTYRPTITKKGKLLYSQVKTFLSAENQLERFAFNLKDQDVSTLRVAIDPVIDTSKIIPAIKKIKKEFPDIEIRLQTAILNGPIDLLKNDLVDIAITNNFGGGMDLEFKPVVEFSLVAVTSPNFIKEYKTIKPEYLEQYTQIVVDDKSSSSKESFGFLETSPKWSVSDFTIKKDLILNGLGWGNMPQHMVKNEIKNKELVVINGLRKSKIFSHIVRKGQDSNHPIINFAFNVFG